MLLFRVFQNLLDNAIEYTPPGGNVEITARLDLQANLVEVAIRDGGPGIAPEVRARLFEPYFSTKSSGTGLGLAIVKRAVEGHAGRIEVDSEPGDGTTFRIVLPATPTSARHGDGVDPGS